MKIPWRVCKAHVFIKALVEACSGAGQVSGVLILPPWRVSNLFQDQNADPGPAKP